MSAHKGVEGGGWGWWDGQGSDLKMEADHDWSPETRLQGCAGSLAGPPREIKGLRTKS